MPELLGLALGPLIVIIVRLLVPFTIFRWPFWGAVASVIVDALDVVTITFLGLGNFSNYHLMDKMMDMYFLFFMVIVSRKWGKLERNIAWGLFAYRFIGFVAFEVTQIRVLLLIFPNLFEFWWLFVAGRDKYYPKFAINTKKAIIILAILLVPKLAQEIGLHFLELQPWTWMRGLLGIS